MSSFRKKLEITRLEGQPRLENGLLIPPATSTLIIKASVQPLKATEMMALPEGRRNGKAVKLYTAVELMMPDQQSGQQADRFEWLGTTYEIVGCDGYQCGVINHYRSIAVEVNTH